MIQRVQSVYLFLIACIMLAMLFFPVANITPISGNDSLATAGFHLLTYILWGLIIGTAILALVAIFKYKHRPAQIKMCFGIIGLIILIYGLYLYLYIDFVSQGPNMIASIISSIAIVFPLLALILDIMAIYRIKKDEKLVKSLDRLR